jgi:hypothetical protein
VTWTTPQTFAVDEELTSTKLNTNVRDNLTALAPDGVTSASWTPSITGSTGGATAPAAAGREYRIGPLQFAWAYWDDPQFEDAGNPSLFGSAQLTLPTAAVGITAESNAGQVIGTWRLYDASVPGDSESGAVYLATSNRVQFGRPVGNRVTGLTPFNTEAGDLFSVYVCYPVA